MCASDLDAQQWDVAVQSKSHAVGCIVHGRSRYVGAIATQSWANPRYRPDGLALLREGHCGREEVVQRLTDADESRAQRQLGIVDADADAPPRTRATSATTGRRHRDGRRVRRAGQHPRLGERPWTRSPRRSSRARTTARRTPPRSVSTPRRRPAGDSRGQQSAAILVVGPGAGLRRTVGRASSTSASTTTRARSESFAGCSDSTRSSSERHRGRAVDRGRRRRLREEIARPARRARLRRASRSGLESPNLEERVEGEDARRPASCSGALRTRLGLSRPGPERRAGCYAERRARARARASPGSRRPASELAERGHRDRGPAARRRGPRRARVPRALRRAARGRRRARTPCARARRRTARARRPCARPASTSPAVTAPIETSETTGEPSLDGIAIASGFVPVSGAPPSGCGRRRGDVAVSAATSPPSASRRTQ